MKSPSSLPKSTLKLPRRAADAFRANRKRGFTVYQLPSGCRLFILAPRSEIVSVRERQDV